jgi:hypothetical protein
VLAHAVVEAKAEAAGVKAALGKEELGSFAFLGGADKFYQLDFNGPAAGTVKAMNAIKIDWKLPLPPHWLSTGHKT